jgi:DNA-binding transcriptional LysR family regulator
LLEETFHQAGFELQVAMNLGSIEVIKRFVENGLGIALVPRVAVREEERSGRLAAVEVRGLGVREIGLVEHQGRQRSPATKAFVALLEKRLAGREI